MRPSSHCSFRSVFIYHNFLSGIEAHHLINLSIATMKKSTVVGPGGKFQNDNDFNAD
jgi:prolyl 4-hydroxylase